MGTHCEGLIRDVDTVAGSSVHMTDPLTTSSRKCQDEAMCILRFRIHLREHIQHTGMKYTDYQQKKEQHSSCQLCLSGKEGLIPKAI